MSIESKPAAPIDAPVVATLTGPGARNRISPLAVATLVALAAFAYFAFVFAPGSQFVTSACTWSIERSRSSRPLHFPT